MKGKDKCKILKEIRREIAANNDINLVIEECTHKGECKGTCPRCEAEVRYLERELEKRQRLGKKLAVVGVSAAIMATTTACSPAEVISDGFQSVMSVFGHRGQVQGDVPIQVDGEIEYLPPETESETKGNDPLTEVQGMMTIDPAIKPETEPELQGEPVYNPENELEGDVPCPITESIDELEGDVPCPVTERDDELEGDVMMLPEEEDGDSEVSNEKSSADQ